MPSVFGLLDIRIRGLLKEKGINVPTPIQSKAIPDILNGRNVLLIAPTGLGKTEAAILPVFNEFLVSDKKSEGIFILYITPLRALNRDMLKRTISWGRRLGISISVRHGDTTPSERAKQVRKPPDMLITTPETFQILFTGKRLRTFLKKIRWVIIDEIHELAGDERGAQLAIGLERLEELTSEDGHSFQRIGLSATVGEPEEVVKFLVGKRDDGIFRDHTIVNAEFPKENAINVEIPEIQDTDIELSSLLSIDPNIASSIRRCRELIEEHEATLLFVNTRDTAEILGSRFHMWDSNFPIDVHHGSLSKQSRIETEDMFKDKKLKSLICTSSLELGIDVGHTDFVIQYNSPREVTRVLQRIGRSGHAIGKKSKGTIITINLADFIESIVIARRALYGKLERLRIRKNPLSVLANQIISIATEYKSVEQEKVYRIIKRAYPFSSLKREIFYRILRQLADQWRIKTVDGKIIGLKKSRLYFIDNISMIPDERSYDVIEITTRRKIGVLDESFVMNEGYNGSSFVLQGKPWKVINVEDGSILVTPIKEIGMVPSWCGEDIPVPFEVSQEVGKIWREIDKGVKVVDYPCSRNDFKKIIKKVEDMKSRGFIVPTDKTITVEYKDNLIVINSCFGTKVNETIGRIVSSLLAQKIGESIRMGSDPYRIVLESSRPTNPLDVKKILQEINPDTIEYILKIVLKNSTFIRWYIIHTAKKFGAISKDFNYNNIGMKKLLILFESTLILDEALDKIIWDRMDIENTRKVLRKIIEGDIKIIIQEMTPLTKEGLERVRELALPHRPDSAILEAIEKRLDNRKITLVCMNCFHRWNTTVKRAGLRPRCPKCGAIRLAMIKSSDVPNIKKRNLTKKEKKEIRKLSTTASMVLSHGRFALLTLAGRGIGPSTAARILMKYRFQDLKDNEKYRKELLKDIWNSELNYAQTRAFWDD